jgi:hypothetical protein
VNNEDKFRLCVISAKRITSSYRSQCPQGSDPVATWVAVGITVAGVAVNAGSQAYAGSQQKKAVKEGAAALQNPTQFTPETLDPTGIQWQAISDAFGGLKNAKGITRKLNKFDYKQATKFLNLIQPSFKGIQQQVGENALSFARGELPDDVVGSITRAAAQQGQVGGFANAGGGSSGMLRNLNLRNLGLTSLDLSKYGTQVGMQVNQSAKSLLPNLGSVRDWILSLPQQSQIAQYNNQLVNQAGLYNTGLANQAQQANAQGILQGGLTDAATTAGIGQTIGGALSGIGSLFGTGGGMGGAGISSLGAQPNYGGWQAGPQPGTFYVPQGRLA